ncbi:MAG: efflux RND transporter periplasmic adaptor subunit, partial [Betaproteobacteria bacterium]|nr:efflux RND transporter periplasmic adaptor subunit [Betaproteobacteria bacterium]
LYAAFDVDERSFLQYIDPAATAKDGALPVYLALSDESGYPRKGRISSFDNRFDPSSGTIRVRAVFENSDGRLVPGLYARIRLAAGQPHQAVLIDEAAVGTDQSKRFVLVLNQDNRAMYREVHLGATQDGLAVVTDGLKPGEHIVVNGLQRVHPGDRVLPQAVSMNDAAHATQADSLPTDSRKK